MCLCSEPFIGQWPESLFTNLRDVCEDSSESSKAESASDGCLSLMNANSAAWEASACVFCFFAAWADSSWRRFCFLLGAAVPAPEADGCCFFFFFFFLVSLSSLSVFREHGASSEILCGILLTIAVTFDHCEMIWRDNSTSSARSNGTPRKRPVPSFSVSSLGAKSPPSLGKRSVRVPVPCTSTDRSVMSPIVEPKPG